MEPTTEQKTPVEMMLIQPIRQQKISLSYRWSQPRSRKLLFRWCCSGQLEIKNYRPGDESANHKAVNNQQEDFAWTKERAGTLNHELVVILDKKDQCTVSPIPPVKCAVVFYLCIVPDMRGRGQPACPVIRKKNKKKICSLMCIYVMYHAPIILKHV